MSCQNERGERPFFAFKILAGESNLGQFFGALQVSCWHSHKVLCDTLRADPTPAGMAELADAADLKSAYRTEIFR